MGLFPHMSMATMTTFPDTYYKVIRFLIIKKINWVE